MKRIVLDCSDPTKICKHCVFNREDGCVAPKGLDDCYKNRGVWIIEDTETVSDILRKMRSMKSSTMHGKMWINTIRSLADRIERALEYQLMVEKARAAGEGYAAGKRSVIENTK